jgi:hypothetical protein
MYLYVGQAYNLAFRVLRQHNDFRYRRDNPSLHYYALDRSEQDQFVVLATMKLSVNREDAEIVLNLLEMWCALMFGSLQSVQMNEWLGDEFHWRRLDLKDVAGLNVALPLDNRDNEASIESFERLKDSPDELSQRYYSDVRKGALRAKAPPRRTSSRSAVSSQVEISTASSIVQAAGNDMALGIAIGSIAMLALFGVRRLVSNGFGRHVS